MVLQKFERRLERLVEEAFAIPYRKGLQPLEIGRRLTREMDLARTMGVRGRVAPNSFTVTLSSTDMDRFDSFSDALVHELASAARDHARDEGYVLLGPVEVALELNSRLKAGVFSIEGEVVEAPGGFPVATLVLEDGQRLPISEEPVLIGRLESSTIVIEDPNVSRRHAELSRQDDAVVVQDLDSTNGTRVNGARVVRRELQDGDQITIGSTSFTFECR
jgi:hypothetical protein